MKPYWSLEIFERDDECVIWLMSDTQVGLKFDGVFSSREEKIDKAFATLHQLNAETLTYQELKVPVRPPLALLESMAARRRHDFWLDKDPSDLSSGGFTKEERQDLLHEMEILFEEATGQGFFKFTRK